MSPTLAKHLNLETSNPERLVAFSLLIAYCILILLRFSYLVRVLSGAPKIYDAKTPVIHTPKRRPLTDVSVLHEHVPREERIMQPALRMHAEEES